MRRYLYLSTAVAGVMMTTGAGSVSAQCVTTQDCAALGYTDSACPGSGVKCPFGNSWYCGGGAAEDCTKLGFIYGCTGTGYAGGAGQTCNGKYTSCTCTSPYTWNGTACTCPSTYKYTCSGTGYAGGSGTACGGKYAACTCASGYTWKNGACTVSRPVCDIGTLYYSDNTCSSNKVSGKTLLGVVIYSNGSSGGGWIMTVSPIKTHISWGEHGDIPGLGNFSSTPTDIQASCTNTDIITAYGSRSTYPAAWAAKNYNPTGTPSGKSWCLPSGGLLNSALNNSTNLAKVNAGITTAGGTILGNVSDGSEIVWSSSEYSSYNAWYFSAYTSGYFNMSDLDKNAGVYGYSVRPVLAF